MPLNADGFEIVTAEPPKNSDGFEIVPARSAQMNEDGFPIVPPSILSQAKDNATKSGYSLIAGGADATASMGQGLQVLEDPGPLRNNFRNWQQSMIRAGVDNSSPEEAVAAMTSERDAQRQALMMPGRTIQTAAEPYATGAQAVAQETPGNEHAAAAARIVGSMVPLLGVAAIPVVGQMAAGAAGGLQATGDTYNKAFQAYKQQGMSDDEAHRVAAHAAIQNGIASAGVFTLLPGAGKSLAEKMMAEHLAQASPVVQAGVRTLAQGAEGSLVMGANSLLTSAQAMKSYNPDLSWPDALQEAAQQAAVGFVATAGVHGAIEGVKLARSVRTSEPTSVGANGEKAPVPVPEAPETVAAQVQATADPASSKAVTLITPGEAVPADHGLTPIETAQGTALVNTDKVSADDAQAQLDAGGGGQLLGMSTDTKPADAAHVLQTTDAEGKVIQDEVVTRETLPGAIEASKQVAPEGKMELKPSEQVIAERQQAAPKRTGGWTKWTPRPDGVPDVLDAIHEEGGIATRAQSKTPAGGEYDGYAEAFKTGMAARLRRSEGGNAPDRLMQQLNTNHGFHFETPDQMYEAVIKAAESRQLLPAEQAAANTQLRQELAQHEDFNRQAFRREAGRTEAVPVGSLDAGDQFKIRGETFTVTDIDPESGLYTVQGGKRFGKQLLAAKQTFHPDKGTLIGANPDWDVATGAGEPGYHAAAWEANPDELVQEHRVQAMAAGAVQAARAPAPGPLPPAPMGAPVPAGRSAVLAPLPSVGPIRTWFQRQLRPLKGVFAPQSIDAHARTLANILRENGGKAAIDLARADQAMAEYRKDFDRTPVPKGWTYDPAKPLPRNYDFLDKVERNRAALSPEHRAFAQLFDDLFQGRIAEVRRLAPNAMKNLITDYFPHIWEDPKAAVEYTNTFAAKSPLHGDKSFLKERSIPYIVDGLRKGLKPVSDNPADLLLMKLHQMDKFILAERTVQEARQIGLRKYLPVGQRVPEGWSIYNDRSSTQYGPPVMTMREAFDAGLRKGLLDFAGKMGWKHERLPKVDAGVNAWGQYTTGSGEIQSRFGGPDFVIAHEIGHGLDERYGLAKILTATHQMNSELTRLAKLRSAGVNTPASFKTYALTMDEKMATVVQAYLHAPELMQAKAPAVKMAFEKFISQHPELSDLNTIKPSLALAASKTEIPLPGITLAGHWIMPDSATQVMNNYVSPGLGRFLPFRTFRAATNITNAAQLGLSAFHLGFTSLDAAVSSVAVGLQKLSTLDPYRMMEGAKDIALSPAAPVTNYYLGKAVQEAMLKPGSNSFKILGLKYGMDPARAAQVNAVAELAVTGGLRATVDPFWQTRFTRNMVRAFHEGGVVPFGKTVLNLPLAIVEQSMRPISEFLVPRQKLGVFAKMAMNSMHDLGPGATHQQVREAMAKAADSTENRMGQMTYDNLFFNKIAKDVALVGFRAFGWQLGKYREALGAAADTASQVKGLLTEGKRPQLTQRMAYVVALPMVVGAIGGIVHRLMTGQNPQTPMDYFFPQTGEKDQDGRPQRLMLPSYMKDLASDWHDFPNLKKMGASFYHKLSPIISTTVDVLRNRDFYGTEIRHADDPVAKQAMDEMRFVLKSFTPFAIAGAQRLRDEQASPGQYALPFFGIVPAKKALTMTPAETRAAELMQNSLPAGARTQAQFDHAQLVKTLVQDLRRDPIQGRFKIQAAWNAGEVKVKDVESILTMKDVTPLQYQVHKLGVDDAMRVWDLANPKERETIRGMLLLKVAMSKTVEPETMSRYIRLLQAAK